MLDHLAVRMILRAVPALVAGRTLHRRGLVAAQAGHPEQAEALFEAAANAYRHEWAVEPMARLRVHQRMVRARAGRDRVHEADAMLEIVRALNKLDQLETLSAPYDLRDAREVLSEWLAQAPVGSAPGVPTSGVLAREAPSVLAVLPAAA